MCNMPANLGVCPHPECPCRASLSLSPDVVHLLANSLQETTQLLRQIVENNGKVQGLVSCLAAQPQPVTTCTSSACRSVLPVSLLNELVTHHDGFTFDYELKLESEFPERVSKGVPFEVEFRVVDTDGKPSPSLVGSKYRSFLYTSAGQLKPLRCSLSGKRILTGTTDAVCGSDATVRFSALVVNEVSSHYSETDLALVVVCLGSIRIRPFIHSPVSVKSRQPAKLRKHPHS